MDDRVEILNNLKTALKQIRRENGFKSTVDRIERGIVTPEMVSERPFISLYNTTNKILETTTTFELSYLRELEIMITGFTIYDKETYNDLDDLAQDLEDFFNSDVFNPYFSWTRIGDVQYYEAPIVDPVCIVQMLIYVKYASVAP